jgi:hypothetical protein
MRPTRTKTLSLEREAHARVIASFLDFEKSFGGVAGRPPDVEIICDNTQQLHVSAIRQSIEVELRIGRESAELRPWPYAVNRVKEVICHHPDALLKGGPETQEHKRFDFHALADRGRADEDPATRWSAAAR